MNRAANPSPAPALIALNMKKCQFSNIADPFSDLFPFKKAPKPSFWESLVLPRERKVLLSQRAHNTPLSLSLSLSLSLRLLCSARAHLSLFLSLSLSLCVCSASSRKEQRFNSVKHRYYVASLILHASKADITAQLLSLFYVHLILSDDGSIIMIFCAD